MIKPVVLVLLVDADRDSRHIFHIMLEHAGFYVVEARTAEDGLRLAREWGPRLVITEFPLPVPGHTCLVEAIRADPALAGTRILAVTALALDVIREQALRAGADGFLTKPVEPSRLLREVQRFLAAPGTAT